MCEYLYHFSYVSTCIDQAALPHILERTKEDFFSKIVDILKIDADLCYHKIEEIPGLTCPNKPEGGMFCMV